MGISGNKPIVKSGRHGFSIIRKTAAAEAEVRIIGLTGMSGAGKTTACQVFRKKGFAVIDCDKIAEKVLCKNSKCLSEIASRFSENAVNEKGELNRRFVADMIFSDAEKKNAYEKIVFPYITFAVLETIKRKAAGKHCHILLDAPTLFESGTDKLCDFVVSVVTELKTAKERIKKRDNISDEEAVKRLTSQKKASFYIERSGFSIINNADVESLASDTEKIIEKIRSGDVW